MQLPACTPHDRVPPEDRGRRELEESNEIVAAPDVDKFVSEDCGLRFGAQAGKELGRQNQARAESNRPDQGRQCTRRHPDVRHTPQIQPARELLDHGANGWWRHLEIAYDACKSVNADGIAYSHAARAANPNRGEQ